MQRLPSAFDISPIFTEFELDPTPANPSRSKRECRKCLTVIPVNSSHDWSPCRKHNNYYNHHKVDIIFILSNDFREIQLAFTDSANALNLKEDNLVRRVAECFLPLQIVNYKSLAHFMKQKLHLSDYIY
jgi:hypothetical protein